MNWLKRAFCYVKRKWRKTLLLYMVFFVAVFTLLGAWSVLDVSNQIGTQMKENSHSKVTLESLQRDNQLNEADIQNLRNIENISEVNRVASMPVIANGFTGIAGSDVENMGKVVLHGYDDMTKDSPFEETICRIVEGREVTEDKEVVINQVLAEQGQIKIGDELSFFVGENIQVTAKVVGFYLTGNEYIQTDAVLTENRIENQIYTSNTLLSENISLPEYEKIVIYIDNPEELKQIAEEIAAMVGEKASVRTMDTTYQKIKTAISQTERITRIIFTLMVVTSVFIIGSLLCMWMRNRKTEIAVFISIGISKAEIYVQMLFETLVLFVVAVIMAAILGSVIFPVLGQRILFIENAVMDVKVSIKNMICVGGIGVMIQAVLVGIAIFPYFRKPVKEILAERTE